MEAGVLIQRIQKTKCHVDSVGVPWTPFMRGQWGSTWKVLTSDYFISETTLLADRWVSDGSLGGVHDYAS